LAAPPKYNTIADSGQAAPGVAAGGVYSSFSNPVLNAAGNTAFLSFLTGSGVTSTNDRGIWSAGGGSLALVAREGSAAPGVAAGGVYSDFGNPVINAAGQTAFSGTFTGTGVDSSNDAGLWATDINGTTLVVREGDLFDVDPNDGVLNKTISGIAFIAVSGGEDGRAMTFNDSGLLAFQLSFTDSTSGIFTALVPIPEPAGLLLLTPLAWLIRRAVGKYKISDRSEHS